MPKDAEPTEEELMKNLSDGDNMPDGITPVDQVPQTADPIKKEG